MPSTPCAEWQGRCDPNGYGVIKVKRRVRYMHRQAWEMAHGPIPIGLCVLHHCDNPPCMNVEHLFLGTRTDNNLDRHRKGRTVITHHFRRGEEHHNAKLSDRSVRWIRESQASQAALARQFSVNQSTISRIINQKIHLHPNNPKENPR